MEGGFYKYMTMQRGSAHFLQAHEKALGKIIDGGSLGDFTLLGDLMESNAQQARWPRPSPISASVGLRTVPARWMPGLKWIYDRTVGLQGDRTFGIEWAFEAAYALVNYPFGVEEQPPGANLPWIAPDPRKGHFIVRPRFEGDGQDLLLTMNLKSEQFKGCHYERSGILGDLELTGFGQQWLKGLALPVSANRSAANEHLGPRIIGYEQPEDKVAVIDLEMSRPYLQELQHQLTLGGALKAKYFEAMGLKLVQFQQWSSAFIDHGIKGSRSIAVDCSGKSGAPLLVAIVDHLEVPTQTELKPFELDLDEPVKESKDAKSNTTAKSPQGIEPEMIAEALRTFREDYDRQRIFLKTAIAQGKETTLRLPLLANQKLVCSGNRFTVGDHRANLSGVFVSPVQLNPDASANSSGTYYVVFTLQQGQAPQFQIDGEGLSATVIVGQRKIRYNGSRLVLQ